MKFLVLSIINLILVLLITACGTSPTYGPIEDEDFEDIFLESLENKEQELLFYSPSIWYPKKNGFKLLPAGKSSIKGVFVCTDKSVFFSEWKGKGKYNVVFSISYDEIGSLRIAANEIFGRIVIKNDTYNSFEILGLSGTNLPNKEQTDIAFAILQKRIGN